MLSSLRSRLPATIRSSSMRSNWRLFATEPPPAQPPVQFKPDGRRRHKPKKRHSQETDAETKQRYETFLEEKAKEGPLRPQLKIPVDPEHGLYGFFRKATNDNGEQEFQVIESYRPDMELSGRSWTAFELRRKSFKDLHTLWYILLRERNLLATQKATANRLDAPLTSTKASLNDRMCRKSMARIKQIINERRLAYENALELQRKTQQEAASEQVVEITASQEIETRKPTVGRRRGKKKPSAIAIMRANSFNEDVDDVEQEQTVHPVVAEVLASDPPRQQERAQTMIPDDLPVSHPAEVVRP